MTKVDVQTRTPDDLLAELGVGGQPGGLLALAEQLVEGSGGHLEQDVLTVEAVEDEGTVVALQVPRQRLDYYGRDGSYLSFGMVVDADLELVSYRFHYARSSGELVWREDKHQGHEELGPAHVHLPGAEDQPCPTAEVDLEVVFDRIRDDQAAR